MALAKEDGKKRFSEEEAAILIDVYIQIQETKISRAEAIQKASEELNLVKKIIDSGLYEIEDAFERGFNSNASYIFIDMVDYYQNDRIYFDEVLQRAKKQIKELQVQQLQKNNATNIEDKKTRKGFSEEETAILIDEYIKVQSGELSRGEAAQNVSTALRIRAINIGMQIDNSFRSLNGIYKQLSEIERLFKNKPSFYASNGGGFAQVFVDMVNYYQNNRTYFDEVLQRAKKQINNKKLQMQQPAQIEQTNNQQYSEAEHTAQPVKMIALKDQYFVWLSEKMSPKQVEEYYSNYSIVEKFCNEKGILQGSFFEMNSRKTLIDIRATIFTNNFFQFKYSKQYKSIKQSMQYFSDFVKENPSIFSKEVIKQETKQNIEAKIPSVDFAVDDKKTTTDAEPIETIANDIVNDNSAALEEQQIENQNLYEDIEIILTEKFQRGFSIKSPIDITKFIGSYNEKFDKNLDTHNENIRNEMINKIVNVGIRYENRIFPISIVSDEVKQQLIQYIQYNFEQGNKVLYYEAMFQNFNDQFLNEGTKIYNADMLKNYLQHIFSEKYYFKNDYMAKENNVVVDIAEKIKEIILNYGFPIELEKIYSQLDYVSKDKIETTIKSKKQFIFNKKGEYFHIDMIDLNGEEIEQITSVIEKVLSIHSTIANKELFSILEEKCPSIERFSQYSDIGKRNALEYYLKDKFSFNASIVSSKDNDMSIRKIFDDFAREHNSFTLDELKLSTKGISNSLMLDVVYKYAIRISETNFVSKEQVEFDVNKIDAALEKYCTGEYIPLQEIDVKFLPDTTFVWTIYLLEQYTAFYSKKFKLIHRDFSITCTGAIVKRESSIDTLDKLLIDVLAKSNVELNNDMAVKYYLQSKGYIATQNYKKIDKIIAEARIKRQ